ncbi:MAG: hypothetical protein A2219_02470 [Elusimicrobia bacterium RIFOXYA2_FULL_50_26]|nr:MAG: hypothetical protein A2219_02470 [Elusimicrobia bacterium RIFOXYA2_FULL_50_26]
MSFKDILHQQKAVDIITGQLISGHVPHAYLFLGPDGVGRKKMALELAKSLNCRANDGKPAGAAGGCDHCISCNKINRSLHPDVQLIDFQWQARLENKDIEKQKTIKIDTIRALQHEISLKPSEGAWKIFIIDPAEKITTEAANCLLKTLEEPPRWTIIILLAKHKENLPSTIVSRTQTIVFCPLDSGIIERYLVANAAVDSARAHGIAAIAEGSLSQALALAAGRDADSEELWKELIAAAASLRKLLSISQAQAKNAPDFLDGLMLQSSNCMRAGRLNMAPVLEELLSARKMLERNANPQILLDALMIKLQRHLLTRNLQ